MNNYFAIKAAMSAINANLQAKGYSAKQAYVMTKKIMAKKLAATEKAEA